MADQTTLRTHLQDGSWIDVPEDAVADWRYEVLNGDTTRGLADWYLVNRAEG